MNTITVYVRLLDEGTDVFRPTLAECMPNGLYRLIATPEYDPDDEHWEFLPDQLVKCQSITLHEGERLVAISLA